MEIETRFAEVAKLSGLKRTGGLLNYFKEQIFRDIDLCGKTMLDLGGGNGIASVYAILIGGCKKSVVVDPYDAGSNPGMLSQFDAMRSLFPSSDSLVLYNGFLKNYKCSDNVFDVVLLHNSINHISERFTETLLLNDEARRFYVQEFEFIRSRLKDQGLLLVSDCSNKNLFGDIGLKSPFAPSIDWRVHQPPNVWAQLLEQSGFKLSRTTWTSRREFGWVGRRLLANALCSYLTTSHFVMEFKPV